MKACSRPDFFSEATRYTAVVLVSVFVLGSQWVRAEDPAVIAVRFMSMEVARDIASAAIATCRAQGYQVSAVVVDRSASIQAVLRDALAPRFTLQIAEEKANAVVLSGVRSAEFRHNRADIRAEMNQVEGILVLDGGVPVTVAGYMLGAVGVSGAPGGEKDEVCANAGVAAVADRLEFAD